MLAYPTVTGPAPLVVTVVLCRFVRENGLELLGGGTADTRSVREKMKSPKAVLSPSTAAPARLNFKVPGAAVVGAVQLTRNAPEIGAIPLFELCMAYWMAPSSSHGITCEPVPQRKLTRVSPGVLENVP